MWLRLQTINHVGKRWRWDESTRTGTNVEYKNIPTKHKESDLNKNVYKVQKEWRWHKIIINEQTGFIKIVFKNELIIVYIQLRLLV